jgi:hypothetical protein
LPRCCVVILIAIVVYAKEALMSDEKTGGDPWGIKPYGEALKIRVEAAGALVKGIGNICGPASEEIGLLLKGDNGVTSSFSHYRI